MNEINAKNPVKHYLLTLNSNYSVLSSDLQLPKKL